MGITGAEKTACIADIEGFNGSLSTLLESLNQHSGRDFIMSEDEMYQAFKSIVPAKQAIASNLSDITSNSYELIVLTSLAYGNANLIGPRLQTAIAEDNRAEAWYELRYGHADQLWARRYVESTIFGLYDNDTNNPSKDEALSVYRMYTKHYSDGNASNDNGMIAYDVEHSAYLASANGDLTAIGGVGTAKILELELRRAADTIETEYLKPKNLSLGSINTLNIQTSYDKKPNLTGEDDANRTGHVDDLLIGDANRNTLQGKSGNDILLGGDGNDTLYGGSGKDILDAGSGKDTLYGENGNDTLSGSGESLLEGGAGYDIYRAMSGDTIKDDFSGEGKVFFEGQPIKGGTRKQGETLYTDSQGNTYSLNGDTLKINGQLTINNFHNKDLGIYLDEEKEPEEPPVYDPNNATLPRIDPLVLDLNKNGQIDSIASIISKAYFDFNDDGIAERSGWISRKDGFLVLDENGNNRIDGLNELFGNTDQGGFEELKGLDSNADNSITSQDIDFYKLEIWQDANGNGKFNEGELKTLNALGITAINLQTTTTQQLTGDNLIVAIGSYTRNGKEYLIADIELSVNYTLTDINPVGNPEQLANLDPRVYQLPWLRGYGLVKSLPIAFQEDLQLRKAAQDLIALGSEGILDNFERFFAKWTGLTSAHESKGITRATITIEDKVWMLETLTGQDINKTIIEQANFNTLPLNWNQSYIESQYQDIVQRAAINFTIQAKAESWITGAYYSLAKDAFSVTDSVHLHASLAGELSSITNYNDAVLAAIILSRFKADGIHLDKSFLTQAFTQSPFASLFVGALDFKGKNVWIMESAGVFTASNEATFVIGTIGNDNILGSVGADFLVGGNGQDLLQGGLGNDILHGGVGNDSVQGDWGNDTYLFEAGSGRDKIIDYDTNVGNVDTIKVMGKLPSEVLLSRDAADLFSLKLSIAGTSDWIRVKNWYSSSDYLIERVVFDDGTVWTPNKFKLFMVPILGTDVGETIHGTNGKDTIDGLGGNDTLYGSQNSSGLGNDTYLFGSGSGRDKIIDYDTKEGNIDTIKVVGKLPSEVLLSRDAVDPFSLKLSIAGTADWIRVKNWYSSTGYRVERVIFDDGTVWNTTKLLTAPILGTNVGEAIHGTTGNDTIDGLGGNDTLYGSQNSSGLGNDTYLFGAGSGRDKIIDYDTKEGNIDTIKVVGKLPSEVLLSRDAVDPFSLKLSIAGTTDWIRVKNWYSSTGYRVERVIFDDGTVWNTTKLLTAPILGTNGAEAIHGTTGNDTIDGLGGNDTLYGSQNSSGLGNDTYLFGAGSGRDKIIDYDTKVGNIDTIKVVGKLPSEVLLSRDAADPFSLKLSIAGTSDWIKVKNWFSNEGYRVEKILFDDGTIWNTTKLLTAPILGTGAKDTIVGTLHNDIINGLAGADNIKGGFGDDTLIGGEGADLLNGGMGKDSYTLTEITAANDTMIIAAGDSLVSGFDVATDFELGMSNSSTAIVDKLDLTYNLIATNVIARNGVDSGVIHSHSIANGFITFDDLNSYIEPLVITSGNLTDVFSYLQSNITTLGSTVTFNADGNTYVFQDGGINDTLVQLTGVIANSISTTGLAANSVWIV